MNNHPTKKQIRAWARFSWGDYRLKIAIFLNKDKDLKNFDAPKKYQQAFKWACGRSNWPWEIFDKGEKNDKI